MLPGRKLPEILPFTSICSERAIIEAKSKSREILPRAAVLLNCCSAKSFKIRLDDSSAFSSLFLTLSRASIATPISDFELSNPVIV